MPIGFTAATLQILNQRIPNLLSGKTILDLPIPLKGQVLYLKGLIRYLSLSSESPLDKFYTLAAGVKLFSFRFPEIGTTWFNELFGPDVKVDCILEERMFECFITLMMKCISKGQTQVFRNADATFDGYELVCSALKHRNELLRLQLFRCYTESPHLQQVDRQEAHAYVDFFKIGESLFKDLKLPVSLGGQILMSELYYPELNRLETLAHDSVHAYFLKSAYQHLYGSTAPISLKEYIFRGLLKLVSSQFEQERATHSDPASHLILNLIQGLQLERVTLLQQWKMSQAAFLFCRVSIFKQGLPEKGLALSPLFGLSEVEILKYWQQASSQVKLTCQALLQVKLDQTRVQSATHLNWFAHLKARSRPEDMTLMPTP